MTTVALYEAGVLFLLVLAGAMFAHLQGLRKWAVVALAPAIGIVLYVVVGLALTLFQISEGALILPAATVAIPAIPLFLRGIRGSRYSATDSLCILAPAVIAFVGGIALFPLIDKLTYIHHTDSVGYLNIGSLIYSGGFIDYVDPWDLQHRPLSVGLMHAPANVIGEYYIRLLNPFIAGSILALMTWFIVARLHDRLDRRLLVLLLISMALALGTANRFVMHSFYMNGHLLAGLCMVMIGGSGWLVAAGRKDQENAMLAMQALATFVLAITRPEGSLLAAIALAPTLVCGRVPAGKRVILAIILGGSMVMWQGFMLSVFINRKADIPASILGMMGVGLALIAGSFLLRLRQIQARPMTWMLLFEAGLWLMLAFLAFRDPVLLEKSFAATIRNLGIYWGVFAIMLGGLFLFALLFTGAPDRIFLRLPVTAYLPLVFLLAYLRESAYRVGGGDSLNRMFISIVPLAVLFIAASAASQGWRIPRLPRNVSVEAAPSLEAGAV